MDDFPDQQQIDLFNKLKETNTQLSKYTYSLSEHVVNILTTVDYPLTSKGDRWYYVFYLAIMLKNSKFVDVDGSPDMCRMCKIDPSSSYVENDPLKIQLCDVCVDRVTKFIYDIKPLIEYNSYLVQVDFANDAFLVCQIIDNVFRIFNRTSIENKHFPRLNLIVTTSTFINFKIFWKCFFKL